MTRLQQSVLAMMLLGCGSGSAPSGSDAAPPPVVAARDAAIAPAVDADLPAQEPAPPPLAPLAFIGSELNQDQIVSRLRQGGIRRLRPIRASQSLVFRARLEGGLDAAYKPRTHQVRWGHRAEVAASRLARVLRMDNVPPAAMRHLRRTGMERQVDADFTDRWSDFADMIRWGGRSSVPGAMIFWVADLNDMELDHSREMDMWRGWLQHDGVVPEDRLALAADLATMVSFDFLIGNWDRFSGGNVDGNAGGTRLYVRDHNVAFAHPLPERLLRRIGVHLRRTQRFSRAWVGALRGLDEASLRDALRLGTGEDARYLLSDAQIRDVLERRDGLLSYIAALIDTHGTDAVMFFP